MGGSFVRNNHAVPESRIRGSRNSTEAETGNHPVVAEPEGGVDREAGRRRGASEILRESRNKGPCQFLAARGQALPRACFRWIEKKNRQTPGRVLHLWERTLQQRLAPG